MITDRWKSSTIISKDQKKENATFPVIFIKKKKKRKIVPYNNWKKKRNYANLQKFQEKMKGKRKRKKVPRTD
jgi:geranylgeranyl pyrophosphate synthase